MVESKLLVKGVPPPALEREFTIVGRPLNRRDALEKVTGQAKYSGDIKLPNMLCGKILRCPHPRARIRRIETRRAEALPGVKAILTKDNAEGWRTYWYNVPQLAFAECITHEGQEVAAVAAEDITIAQKALDLIDVEYEVLPPMLDVEETLETSLLPLVADEEYPGREIYDRKPYVIKRGDIDKGFAEADVIVEDTYTTQASYHGTIQTRACVASWDNETLTVWDAIQGVWNSKEALGHSMGIAPEKVRVIVKYIGGGFGSKAWSHRISFYAAKLSIVTRRPVRIERTRGEEFLAHPRRWDCKMYIKIGTKRDGTLTAIYERALVNAGAAALETNYYAMQIIWHTSNLHGCPNVYLEQIGVFTNLQINGPTRSPLNMPAIFGLESHMDRVAEAIGMDPLEFRLKNYTNYCTVGSDAGEVPNAALIENDAKIPYSSKTLDECMKLVTKAIGWEKRKSCQIAPAGSRRRGVGMASYLTFQGVGLHPYTAYADVEIKHDGTITLFIGVVDIGGGQGTIFPMIAAEELGVNPDDITVVFGDTKDTRYGPSCHVSRVTSELGPAVLQAAAEARRHLFEIAAPILGAKAEELQSKYGQVYVKSGPWRSVPLKTVYNKIDPEEPIRGGGARAPNPNSPAFSIFGAQAAEVEVDIETGRVDVLRIAAAHDFGRAINPKLCVSQVQGGIEFGVGFALSEEGLYDPKTGKLLNKNLHQYKMPTSLDMPQIDTFLVGAEDPYFAYSAKGAGENTNAPTPAAIRNAIYNAIGIWFNDLPITPDKILKAIHEKRKGG